MSKVEFRNSSHRLVVHVSSRRAGDLQLHDRVVTRGTGEQQAVITTFAAIFSFDDPPICSVSDVPDYGGYFVLEDGSAEVTQLIRRFQTDADREAWVQSLFEDGAV